MDSLFFVGFASTHYDRGSQQLRAGLRKLLDAPLAEPPDTLLSQLNPNRTTKNVGHFLRIDVVAQVPSPSLAWRR